MLAVGVFVAWSAAEGGYEPTSWYPGALFLIALLALVLVAWRHALADVPRITWIAVALLGLFVAWSFISITWAGVKGDAWDGANRSLLYFSVFALFAIPRWRWSSAAIVMGGFSLAVA